MCGIVGARDDWLRASGLDPEAAMRAAVERLRWRGPDGADLVRIGDWWLGCARLAISQPYSRQPVVRRGRRYAAVLNGAITNARELWAELLPGAERRASPPNDAWLPLLAVERGRHELLARMRGHHAYAVIDVAAGELVHGQDRFGEKPLLLLCGPRDRRRLLAFGSSLPALQALGVPAPSVTAWLAPMLRFGFAEFAPLHYPDQLQLQRPWRGRPLSDQRQFDVPPSTPPTTGGVREQLVASVRRCADTTVAAGLFLSGGIDSSCLAAALRAVGRPLPAFQFRADGTPENERALARAVAAHCQLPLREVDGGPDVLDALPRLTRCAGLPLGDPSVLAVHATARAAAAEGIKVMLGGEGADELFFGYRRYRALAWLPRLPWLARTADRWSMHYRARWWRAVVGDDPAAALLAVTPPALAETVLAPNFRLDPDRRGQPQPHADDSSRPARARAADLDGYLRLDLLPKIDVATMAAGIESRCPYLEGDAAADATPALDLGKRRLRAAFAGDLPPAVFRQRKRGFALPLDRWCRGELPLLDLLRDRRTLGRPHLLAGGVTTAIDRHRAGRCNLGHGLYLLAAVETFLRCQEEDSPDPGNELGPGA